MSYPVPLYKRFALVLGGALILLGLALIVVAASAHTESPMFMIGGLVLVGGVVRITTALAADAKRQREHPFDPSDPRWHDGAGVVQLAGRSCVECGRRIIIGAEARQCEECSSPTHIDCQKEHRAHAHGESVVGRFPDVAR